MSVWNQLLDRVVAQLGHDPEIAKHHAFRCLEPMHYTAAGQRREYLLGMTTIEEQSYFEWYAAHLYRNQGRIVELGCWLGSLTTSLLRGLEKNELVGPEDRLLDVYDLFEWEAYMDDYVRGTHWEGRVQAGDDYRHLFEASMAAHLQRLRIIQADLATATWKGGPIAMLLVDAMKSMPLAQNILTQFFPWVVTGGVVAHQDYLHPAVGWLQVSMYQLRDYFRPVLQVPNSDTVVFHCIETPPADALVFPDSVADLPLEQIEAAYTWNHQFIEDGNRDRIAASEIWLHLYRRDFDRVRSLYARAKEANFPNQKGLDMLRDHTSRYDLIQLEAPLPQ